MARTFRATFEDVTVAAAQDLFEILAPTKSVIMVIKFTIFQTSLTGDTNEELWELETVKGVGSSTGTGGSTITPAPIDGGDGSAGATVKANNTVRMSAGTLTVIDKIGHNIRIPQPEVYLPEERPIISPGDRWTLSLNDTPTSCTASGSITFAEIGG